MQSHARSYSDYISEQIVESILVDKKRSLKRPAALSINPGRAFTLTSALIVVQTSATIVADERSEEEPL